MSTKLIPPPPASTRVKVSFGKIDKAAGHRSLLYGTGGIGKTTLATRLPGRTAFLDLDESLARLQPSGDLVTVPVSTWQDIRDALQSDGWDSIQNIVIDSVTKAEELALAHAFATIKTEKGMTATSIESYGYGKGYRHLYESFLPLLSDLDRHCRAGRNVLLIAHECVQTVPNPSGEDWIRYEPRLQTSDKVSIRLRVKEWADHVLFMGYDVNVEDGKGEGGGTRTIYTAELPHCMAKSRTTQEQIVVGDGSEVWGHILK